MLDAIREVMLRKKGEIREITIKLLLTDSDRLRTVRRGPATVPPAAREQGLVAQLNLSLSIGS